MSRDPAIGLPFSISSLVFCKDSSINTFPTTVEAISTDLKIETPPFISVANVLANLAKAPL